MRYAPPPVQYPVDRPVAGAAPAVLAGLACASAWGAWALQASVVDVRLAIGALGCVLAIGWAVADWRAAPRGWLAWNGAHWHWDGHSRCRAGAPAQSTGPGAARAACPGGCDVHVALHLDLQSVMLLRLRSGGSAAGGAPPRWLWLERGRSPAAWPDLRRAVLHAARSPATAVAADGAAGSGAERVAP